MPIKILDIHATSPLLFRDGKPFSAAGGTETSARSLPVPLPSTLAGFIRTQIGTAHSWNWKEKYDLEQAHTIPVAGLLVRDCEIVIPAPRDAVIIKDNEKIRITELKPLAKLENAGTDAPEGIMPLDVPDNLKAETGYVFWTQENMTTWLLNKTPETLEKIEGLPLETRVHVKINKDSQTADEGQLFSVGYRSFESRVKLNKDDQRYRPNALLPDQYIQHHWSIRTRVKIPDHTQISSIGHLGGERRVVALEEKDHKDWFHCPEELKTAILESKKLKLVLATPAIFSHGWKPAWLESKDSTNMPKGLHGLKLKLISAAVGRREPVSGWNMRENSAKAVRYMVPAGSVYFFELLEGDPAKILENWLKPVSDIEQDRKDGFGLALWGVWK